MLFSNSDIFNKFLKVLLAALGADIALDNCTMDSSFEDNL